jgi:predicted neuraminidase
MTATAQHMPSVADKMDGLLRPNKATRWDAFIPSPSPQNHAAFLSRLPGGELACVWFGGTMEGMPDISIHMSVLDENSKSWSPATVLIDDRGRSEQNPVLYNAADGKVWLLYTSQRSGNQDTSVVRRRISADGGKNFGPAETMIADAGTFIRQPIVTLASGDLLLPVFKCRVPPGEKWSGNTDNAGVYRSSDRGKSWSYSEVPDSLGCVHMNILPVTGSHLVAFYRSRWADFIHRSESLDGAKTWSAPRPSPLPNNNSSIQCVRLSDGRLAMVYNHSSAANATGRRTSLYDEIDDGEPAPPPSTATRQAFWGAPRAPMSLSFSSDNGLTWQGRSDLDTSDGFCLSNNSLTRANRELSYPVLLEGRGNTLDVAFTWFRQGIKHVRIKLA